MAKHPHPTLVLLWKPCYYLSPIGWHNFQFTNLLICRWKEPITCLLVKIPAYYLLLSSVFPTKTNQSRDSLLKYQVIFGCCFQDFLQKRTNLFINVKLIYLYKQNLKIYIEKYKENLFIASVFYVSKKDEHCLKDNNMKMKDRDRPITEYFTVA